MAAIGPGVAVAGMLLTRMSRHADDKDAYRIWPATPVRSLRAPHGSVHTACRHDRAGGTRRSAVNCVSACWLCTCIHAFACVFVAVHTTLACFALPPSSTGMLHPPFHPSRHACVSKKHTCMNPVQAQCNVCQARNRPGANVRARPNLACLQGTSSMHLRGQPGRRARAAIVALGRNSSRAQCHWVGRMHVQH